MAFGWPAGAAVEGTALVLTVSLHGGLPSIRFTVTVWYLWLWLDRLALVAEVFVASLSAHGSAACEDRIGGLADTAGGQFCSLGDAYGLGA